jgi:hypothetical protein
VGIYVWDSVRYSVWDSVYEGLQNIIREERGGKCT